MLGGIASAAVAVTLLLTGCSASSDSAESAHVASIAPTSAPTGATSTPSGSVDDQRPLVRADTSPEQAHRLWEEYYACERDNGIPTVNQDGNLKPMDDGSAKYADARAACASMEPEGYQDRMARNNPGEYQDRFRAYEQCMGTHGMTVKREPDVSPGSVSYTSSQPLSMAKQMQFNEECEVQAFSGN